MRLRNAVPGLGLLALAAFLLLTPGCSDDSPAPVGSNQDPGSPTDPEFLLVQDQIDDYLDQFADDVAVGAENVYQLPTDTEEVRNIYGPMSPDDTVLYTYAQGWHVVYVSRDNAYFSDYFRDSIQFQDDGLALEDPDNLDYLHFIRHWGYQDNQVDQTHTNRSGHINLEYENLDTDQASVNGYNNVLVEWNYISDDTTITAMFNMAVTVENVILRPVSSYGWINGCPCSGRLTFDMDHSYNLDDGSSNQFVVRSWTVTVDYDEGYASVRVERDNEYWTYERQVCSTPTI